MASKFVKNVRAVGYGLAALRAYGRGVDRCDQPPTTLWIEPTNRCNLRCVMCPVSLRTREDSGFMGLDAYQALIDETAPYVTTVNLFLGGESLLHKDLFDMIRYARSRGMTVRLNTNATLLNRRRAEQLLDSGLDHLIFSFDGYNATTYESIRINARFEPTLQNILDFLALKKERRARRPYTMLQTIVVREGQQTEEEERAFRARFEGLPLDAFILREAHTWRGVFEETDRFDPHEYGVKYVPCPYLWSTLSVSWDGTVVPCCLDTWADYPLGRVGEQPLLEIWNSEPMRALRRKLLAGQYEDIPLCSGCDMLWADKTVGRYPHTLLKVALSHPVENLLGYRLTNIFKRLVKGDL
jgi:radical SAM protein with 4Fe4S-binding SPASM domain